VDDSPAEAILKTAEAVKAGLIVMGTHGRTGYNRWLLGSVAERVLRESPAPVLTVRSAPPEGLGRILVPVEDTEISRHALEMAVRLAACSGAEITVLHVGGSAHPIANLCAWVPASVRAQCQVRELTKEEGDAASAVIQLAESGAYDLIVLGAPRRKFFGGMVMGATALRTIRHAQCPVLTVGAA
jgi:nucleotide-binding universal stress UspA family protein